VPEGCARARRTPGGAARAGAGSAAPSLPEPAGRLHEERARRASASRRPARPRAAAASSSCKCVAGTHASASPSAHCRARRGSIGRRLPAQPASMRTGGTPSPRAGRCAHRRRGAACASVPIDAATWRCGIGPGRRRRPVGGRPARAALATVAVASTRPTAFHLSGLRIARRRARIRALPRHTPSRRGRAGGLGGRLAEPCARARLTCRSCSRSPPCARRRDRRGGRCGRSERVGRERERDPSLPVSATVNTAGRWRSTASIHCRISRSTCPARRPPTTGGSAFHGGVVDGGASGDDGLGAIAAASRVSSRASSPRWSRTPRQNAANAACTNLPRSVV